MLLLGALLALLAVGLWMYALIDVLLTPEIDCRGLAKKPWLAVTGLLLLPGALAWLVFGRPYAVPGRPRPGSGNRRDLIGLDAEAALRRHPAGRARPGSPGDLVWQDAADGPSAVPYSRVVGPDDDPEFLRYLDRVITDIREAGNGA
ncbi:MAG TPA: hypothetical protein VGL63_05200 [Streptosporangiaceae bacterium]|jgi:hypothetical protein